METLGKKESHLKCYLQNISQNVKNISLKGKITHIFYLKAEFGMKNFMMH